MKPILILSLVCVSILFYSCEKTGIRKNDLVGTWDLHYSESRTNEFYPVSGGQEIFSYLYENNTGIYEFTDEQGYTQGDTNTYLDNYIEINRDHSFKQVNQIKRFDEINGQVYTTKLTTRGYWYFISENLHHGINENERVAFILQSETHEFFTADSSWAEDVRHYPDNSFFFTWHPTSFSSDELELETESNYILYHNDHIDINSYYRAFSIFKKRN